VGLAQAMNMIADDRKSQSTAREVLSVLTGADGQWLSAHDVAGRSLYDESSVLGILDALASGRVLDFEPASGRYRYHSDTVNDLEVKRFLRRADGRERAARTNVDRFRQRYGSI
jgi:DNA-binding IclR family transcriptional regulator